MMPIDMQPGYLADRPRQDDLDLLRYGRFLASYWIVLAVFVVAGAATGVLLGRLLPPSYQATATLAITPPGAATAVPLTARSARALIANVTLATEVIRETGLVEAGWTPQRFVDEAVETQAIPGTNLLKLHVALRDPVQAKEAASRLAAKAAQLSRRIDHDSSAATRESLRARAEALAASVKESENGLFSFQMSAEIERLEADVRAAFEEQRRHALSAAAQSALASTREQLYRRRFELERKQIEYDTRLRAYTDVKARAEEARTWPVNPSQLQVVDGPVLPVSAAPRPLAQFGTLGGILGFAAGAIVALVLNHRRAMTAT